MFKWVMLVSLLLCGDANAVNFYAVCVGINHYSGQQDTLTKCVSSASALKESLEVKLGWSSSNITLLTNSGATRSNILNAIDAMPQTDGNICLFFFSGHGLSSGFIPYEGAGSIV